MGGLQSFLSKTQPWLGKVELRLIWGSVNNLKLFTCWAGNGWWVGGWVKTDFIIRSGSSEPSLDSESKLEPSVAIVATNVVAS